MRKLFFLVWIISSLSGQAQFPGTFYVAAKNGLSLREKPDIGSKAILKIPYGTKITISYPDEPVNITSDGMDGQWTKTSFSGKAGFVVNSYLLPWPPPKATVKTMKQYLAQVSAIAGVPVNIKKNAEETEENYYSLKKQLFKNGAEYHEELFYEGLNNIYVLPEFNLQQGFLLTRLIAEFKDVFPENAAFPTESLTIKRGEIDYIIKVEKPGDSDWIDKITVEYEEGAGYSFQMFPLGAQLAIIFGGGL